MSNKNKVEAILYTVGKFIGIEDIAKLTGISSIDEIKDMLNKLKDEYVNRDSSLEIQEENGRYKLSIKKDYLYLTEKLLTNAELDKPTQETLAIIAYKNPVLQAEVIKMRGNKAYDHIKTLQGSSFITSEKTGRTRTLKLTPKFFEYFDVVEDKLSLKDENKTQ